MQCGDGDVCPPDYRCGGDGYCHPADLAEPRDCAGGPVACQAAGECGVEGAVCRCEMCAAPDPDCQPSGLRTLGEGGACIAAPVRVAAGGNQTCALMSDSGVFCWGAGQLGPVEVEMDGQPLADVLAIHPGERHTCALLQGGGPVCWGDNDRGQLGRGTAGGRESDPAPVVDADGEPVVGLSRLASGWSHTCAVDAAGEAWCWGGNSDGELGTGDMDDRANPAPVDTTEVFAAITAGANHSCAIDTEGGAWCWGRNMKGQLGSSATQETVPEPRPVAVLEGEVADDPLVRVHALSAGDELTCAATWDPEQLWCWGHNRQHALGDDTCPTCADGYNQWLASYVELEVASAVQQLSAGGRGACVILEDDGQLWCWGGSDKGQIGVPTPEPWLAPTHVMDGAIDVALGADHACALVAGGQVMCWGRDDGGELGTGEGASSAVPVPIAETCP